MPEKTSKITKEERNNAYLIHILCIFTIFVVNILFNGWICSGNRAFYLDDMYLIDAFHNTTSASEWILDTGANKFRVVNQIIIGIVLKLVGKNYEIIDEVLLAIQFINAILVYAFAYVMQHRREITCRAVMSCACAMLFTASRLAYYNISEVLGMMEGAGLAVAIGMLLLLFCYMESGKRKYYYWAAFLYLLLIYIHERYFVLFFLFPLVLSFQRDMNWQKKCRKIVMPLAVLVSFWIIRINLFGNRTMDGTGGTSINDTFNFKTAISFCFNQIGYILGFNCGPQYLNGIDYTQVPYQINALLLFNSLFIVTVSVLYIRLLIVNSDFRKENLKKVILFIMFIGSCIVCSSITIRVEMRWIYVSYAAFLILLFYLMYGLLDFYSLDTKKISMFCIYIVCVLITEQFYRDNYNNIYYWTDKDLSREIYNVTIEKYGSDLENRDIIIIGDYWKNREWQSDNWQMFFAPYIDSTGINVIYAEDIYEADQLLKNTDRGIILLEDQENLRYVDITDRLDVVKFLYGIYEDCWCDMNCAFELRGGAWHNAVLRLYYPEELEVKGTPNGKIIINGEKEISYDLTGSLTTIELPLSPQQTNNIQIMANYWVHENTGRSEDGRLSNTLSIDIN